MYLFETSLKKMQGRYGNKYRINQGTEINYYVNRWL
jgi:hypothetical protein